MDLIDVIKSCSVMDIIWEELKRNNIDIDRDMLSKIV